MASVPVVREFKVVKKGMVAKSIRISFKCPHCEQSLIASEEEVGIPDYCPHCNQAFMVDKRAKAAFQPTAESVAKASKSDPAIAKQTEDALKAESEAQLKLQRQRELEQAEEQRKRNDAAQRKAAEQERAEAEEEQASITQQKLQKAKDNYRAHGVRIYPGLSTMAELCDGLSYLHLVCSVICFVWSLVSKLPDEVKVAVAVSIVGQAAVGYIGLKFISGFIYLAINLAQDTERLLLAREADDGKPWAKF
jgi:ribosomal protein L37AE/L43A